MAQEAPHTIILSKDKASLYLQASTQNARAQKGNTPIIRIDPGRRKTNFYGTLNLQTGQDLVLRAEKLNNAMTAFYLNCLLETYPTVPILLLWERAPWHRGAAIERVLQANPRLEILWYPVASPELNPQAQVWKQTRRNVSHNHTQPHLEPLADRFEKYLSETTFHSVLLDHYGYTAIRPMFI